MGMIKAQSIVTEALTTLLDPSQVRYSNTELLGYLNDGQREIVRLRPAANTVLSSIQLSAGTRQQIPAGGQELIDVIRGMGSDGQTPGRAVRQVDRHTLDAANPLWHQDTASLDIVHFMFDDRDPTHFYVTPPQPNPAGYVEVSYAAIPADIALTDSITLADSYSTGLLYYVLARAYAKDSGSADFNKASNYQQLFMSLLSGDVAAQQRLMPDQMAARAKH